MKTMGSTITWTELLAGALLVLCFYSLYFYLSSTGPLRAEVIQLRQALLALTKALATEQSERESQALTHEAILTSKARTLVGLRNRCAELQAKCDQRAEQYVVSGADLGHREVGSAIPDLIRDDDNPTLRILEAESLRLAALGNDVSDPPMVSQPTPLMLGKQPARSAQSVA